MANAIIIAVGKMVANASAWVMTSKLMTQGINRSAKHINRYTYDPQPFHKITLNIGGKLYPTSRRTILSSPKLSSLLITADHNIKNRLNSVPDDQFWHHHESEFFIDRDPSHFRYILNYIRNRNDCVLPTDQFTRKELQIEAKYYELYDLVELLNDCADDNDIDIDIDIAIQSNLITSSESSLLIKCINDNDNDEIHSINLLYRGSENEFSSSIFHEKCDFAGKTLTIIQSENGFIFGGYTHCNWYNENDIEYNNNNKNGFIFLLTTFGNQSRVEIEKWKLQNNGLNNEIVGHSDYGPCFINSITILDKANITDQNEAYIPSIKQHLAGSVKFKVKEYEVFKVTKLDDYQILNTIL